MAQSGALPTWEHAEYTFHLAPWLQGYNDLHWHRMTVPFLPWFDRRGLNAQMTVSGSGTSISTHSDLDRTEISPNSLPLATFLRLPQEKDLSVDLYAQSRLSAAADIQSIRVLNEHRSSVEASISAFYSRRSIAQPLVIHLQVPLGEEAGLSEIASREAQPLVALVTDAFNAMTAACDSIGSVMGKPTPWSEGLYSNELFESLCGLIFSLFVLDQIHFVKKSVSRDLQVLQEYVGPHPLLTPQPKEWLNGEWALFRCLHSSTRQISLIHLDGAAAVVCRYIKEWLQADWIMLPGLKHVLIISLFTFAKFLPAAFQQADVKFAKATFERIPNVPLYHEFSFNVADAAGGLDIFRLSGLSCVPEPPDPSKAMSQMWSQYTDVSTLINRISGSPPDVIDAGVIPACIEAVRLISTTTNLLREQYAAKLARPPFDPPSMKSYERSVRKGYNAADLKAMLQLLALARELHDLIRLHFASIFPKLAVSIFRILQNFLKNTLELAVVRAKHQKDRLRGILESLRIVGAEWLGQESPQVVAKKPSDVKRRLVSKRLLAPSRQLVQLIRIQLQHLLNPESVFMQPPGKFMRGGKGMHEADELKLVEFLQDSINFVNLLSLEDNLQIATDQSCFYFKEVQLDLNDVVQFPVRSSLPFILCQFALDNYIQPELTEIIFYPLSIYNDAAFAALHKHKSSMMFAEIRAEARVCVDTLSALIGEFTFNAFRTFATLRKLPPTPTGRSPRWPVSQAYRLRTLLQQNQFFLLSTQISLGSLIASRVDQELNGAVNRLYEMGQELGVIASVAVSRVVNIVRETHRLLVEQGLAMMPFKDVERAAKQDGTPDSFHSQYVDATSHHLFRKVSRKYLVAMQPLRLIPPKRVQLPAEPLGKRALGRTVKEILEGTVANVSVEHFAAWIGQLSDGAISLLVNDLRQYISRAFYHFSQRYRKVAGRLMRIRDAPFGTAVHNAFNRYEGAYKYFFEDAAVGQLLSAMRGLGNAFVVAELIDQAMARRALGTVQMVNFLRGVDQTGGRRDEILHLFDAEFRSGVKTVIDRPTGVVGERVFVSVAVATLVGSLMPEVEAFVDQSGQIVDFAGMTGFACVWAVLEFVYCVQESNRDADQAEGFAKYGFGVMVCAALLLLAAEQAGIARIVSIGRKLRRHRETDLTGMVDEKIDKVLAAFDASLAVVDWALLVFEPLVQGALTELPAAAQESRPRSIRKRKGLTV